MAAVMHTRVQLVRAYSGGSKKSLGQAMAFTGPGPELINGRLAMFAFVAAASVEASTNQTVVSQLRSESGLVGLGLVLITVGSLVPITKGVERKRAGPFMPGAEMLNGRLAMLGFASLLVVESCTGHAFF